MLFTFFADPVEHKIGDIAAAQNTSRAQSGCDTLPLKFKVSVLESLSRLN